MDLQNIHFSPEDIAELQQPYGPKQAMAAFKLGFAMGLGELGLMPGEFEKSARNKTAIFDWGKVLTGGPELYADAAALLTGVGAAAGAYTGYARANVQKELEGRGDPATVELKRKLKGYQGLMADLKRNNVVQQPPPQLPV